MRIAVYGGSFFPPHVGHGMVAAWLRWADRVDEVWLVPTFTHPFGKRLAPFEHRLAWAQALAATVGPWVKVSDIERQLGGTSYTVVTLDALAAGVLLAAVSDPTRFVFTDAAEHARGLALLGLAAALAGAPHGVRRVRQAMAFSSLAGRLGVALGVRHPGATQALDRCLGLIAEHELNASAFAARITASTGADLYACVAAGLCAISGGRHGGACDRIESLLHEVHEADRAVKVLHDRLRRGESIPGFGHKLYPDGDPRTPPLLEAAFELAPDDATLHTLQALIRAAADAGIGAPSVDLGLVAVAKALQLPNGSATAVFAVGRIAGFVAHALEQRRSTQVLRPRARYVPG